MKTKTYEEKISKIMTDSSELGLPSSAPLLAMLLKDYRPIIPPGSHFDNMTSSEIAQRFEDICNIDIKEVTAVMLYLGYRLHCGSVGGAQWSMSHIPD